MPDTKSRDAVVAARGPKSLELGQESRNQVTRSKHVTRWKWFEIGGFRKRRFFQFGVVCQ